MIRDVVTWDGVVYEIHVLREHGQVWYVSTENLCVSGRKGDFSALIAKLPADASEKVLQLLRYHLS